jgi:Ca-activated chloride channel family protein
MRSLPLISLSLLLLSWQTVCAQIAPADDYFNSGAQSYISNNIAQAKEAVATGLKFYPDDIKLKKLEELLKQQSQQQQQQNQQSQQNQKQQQQSKQNQSQQQSQKNQQQQQDQQAQNQSGQEKDKQQQEQQQQAKSAGKQSDEKQDEQTGQAQAAKAQEMSPEQAKRLLDAQKGDEQFLQLKPKNPPESSNRPIKDW